MPELQFFFNMVFFRVETRGS
uniref:Uncharacterized protein n=1 Tax=Arundo donax TaxID=35708 RepID=A0A0A9F464_ARUDO